MQVPRFGLCTRAVEEAVKMKVRHTIFVMVTLLKEMCGAFAFGFSRISCHFKVIT